MLILGHVRLSKDWFHPSGYKGIRMSPRRFRAGVSNIKKKPFQLIFKNLRSSILPESSPDPNIFDIKKCSRNMKLKHLFCTNIANNSWNELSTLNNFCNEFLNSANPLLYNTSN